MRRGFIQKYLYHIAPLRRRTVGLVNVTTAKEKIDREIPLPWKGQRAPVYSASSEEVRL